MTAITQDKIRKASGFGPISIFILGLGIIVLTLALMALSYGNGQASDNSLSIAVMIHLGSVVPALPLGAYVLLRRKGDRVHKLLGKIWVVLMLVAGVGSFWIGSGLSFIHLFSVLVLVSVPISIFAIRRGDVVGHRRAMEGMYIGLVIAGAFAFIPGRLLGSSLFG